ncbi:hypothetical protein ACQ4LE_004776 [Meloidogyne hapla]
MSNEINLKWLSWNAQRPYCIVGMDSLTSFLPCPVVRSNRISWQKKVHPYGKGCIPILKQINDLVYAELIPEMRTVKFQDIDPSLLDVILISNSSSFIALPFITEGTGFNGVVYATEPIVQLSKLLMEDLCDTFEQIDRPLIDEWSWKNISNSFPNPPSSDPNYWKPFYKRIDIENCMKRVQLLFFRQEIALSEDIRVTPYSSGHSIGSCNWLLCTNQQRIGYFAASSLRPSHPKPMELNPFNNLDALILTSIHTNDQSPDITVYKFTSAVVETLKMGGNVLIPIIATGLIYDLFEIIVKAIEVNNLSRNIPVYFISSIAESSLEFANIFSEWLSDDKGARVYKPEEPFYHSEMLRNRRIRVYDSLHGPFSKECRQPSIVFAGHPSLRIGEIVHLLDLWGGNSKNAIMMIDPDYPLETYYSPYKTLAIRAYFFPIETRLDCNQVFNKIIKDLSPQKVLYPEEYSSSFSTLNALPMPTICFKQNEQFLLKMVKNNGNNNTKSLTKQILLKRKENEELLPISIPWKRVKVDYEVLRHLKLKTSFDGLCPIKGLISATNNQLEFILNSKINKNEKQILEEKKISNQKFSGRLNVIMLRELLEKREFQCELIQTGDEENLIIKNYSARIRIIQGGRRTLINCCDEIKRKEIQSAVHECLSKFVNPELINETLTSLMNLFCQTNPKTILIFRIAPRIEIFTLRGRNDGKIYWPGSGIRTKKEIEEEAKCLRDKKWPEEHPFKYTVYGSRRISAEILQHYSDRKSGKGYVDFAFTHYPNRPFMKSALRQMIPYYAVPVVCIIVFWLVDFNWFWHNGRRIYDKYFKSEAAEEETNEENTKSSKIILPFEDDDEIFVAADEKVDECSIVGKKKKKKIGFRERRVIHYEDRIRAYSSPDKIFRYFATIKLINEDGTFDIFMKPEDFVRSLTPGVMQPRKYGLDKYKIFNTNEILERKINKNNIFNWLSDNGGLINFGDYLFLMTLLSTSPSEFKLAFYVFDLNGDGELDRQEFERVQELILSQSNIGQRHRDHITGTGTFTKSGKHSAITRHFFGSDNLQKLNIDKFLQFQKDLHYDILKIEFERRDPESGPVGIISEVSFARLLMIHSDLPEKRQKRMLKRVKRKYNKEMINKKGVSFEEVNNFFAFIYHIDNVDLALHFYKLAGKPLSKELIKRVARKITNVELSDTIVDIVVTLFDENGDGELSQKEFISIMKQRKQRGLERPKDTGLTRLLDALWVCSKNQLNTSLNNENNKLKEQNK